MDSLGHLVRKVRKEILVSLAHRELRETLGLLEVTVSLDRRDSRV